MFPSATALGGTRSKASPCRVPSWSWPSVHTSIPGGALVTESTFHIEASAPKTLPAIVNFSLALLTQLALDDHWKDLVKQDQKSTC
jgi:hypothetical protein